MGTMILRRQFVCWVLCILFIAPVTARAYEASIILGADGNHYIKIWNRGYSDTMIVDNKDYLSGDWAAAIKYDGINNANETEWLEPHWLAPFWTTNSSFSVKEPLKVLASDGNGWNRKVESVIKNDKVEITITTELAPSVALGLSPAMFSVETVDGLVVKQTYAIKNTSNEILTDLGFFQMLN